jgi:hypothetical protein
MLHHVTDDRSPSLAGDFNELTDSDPCGNKCISNSIAFTG